MTSTSINLPFESNWQVPHFQIPLWLGKKHHYCVVIPVINEGSRITNLLRKMQTLGISKLADIIIVDGGSTDGSLELEKLEQYEVQGLLVKTDSGKLSAQLRCAYAFALLQEYSGIVTIDGNDKDDPEAIPLLIEALKNSVDFVQGSRFISGGIAENTPKARYIAIRFIHAPLLSLFSGFRWTDTTQGFRGYSRKLLMDIRVAPFRNVFSTYELLAYLSYRSPRLGYRCLEVPTTRRYPKTGKVPTKISKFRGNFTVLNILIMACLGFYNPKLRTSVKRERKKLLIR
jgi:dolichol-phosphate mannosyltransferase